MHRQQFTANPSPYGIAYAFQESKNRGMRVLDHSGGQLGFSSYLFLVPELNLGVFISQNVRENSFRWAVAHSIMETFIPEFAYPDLQLEPANALDTRPYAGVYRNTGYTHHTFEKMAYVLGFIGSDLSIQSAGSGAILINDQRYVLNNKGLFVHTRYGFVARNFLKDQNEKVAHHTYGKDVFERISWWERKEILQFILALSMALSLWHVTIWPWLIRQRIRKGIMASSRGRKFWRRLIYTASGLWFITFVLFFAVTSLLMERPVQFDYGATLEMKVALGVLLFAIISVLAIPTATILAWSKGWWSIPNRIGLTIYSLFLFGAIAVLGYMNMIGFQY